MWFGDIGVVKQGKEPGGRRRREEAERGREGEEREKWGRVASEAGLQDCGVCFAA